MGDVVGTVSAEIEHEQRHGPACALQATYGLGRLWLAGVESRVRMMQVGVGDDRVERLFSTGGRAHVVDGLWAALDATALDRTMEPQLATQLFVQADQRANQRSGSTSRKEYAPIALQVVNQ